MNKAPFDFDPGTTNSKFVYLNYDIRSLETPFGSATFSVFATNATDRLAGSVSSVLVAGPTTEYQELVDVTGIAVGCSDGTGD